MPVYARVILGAGWLIWGVPFFLFKRNPAAPQTLDRRARWGLLLHGLSFVLVWFHKSLERPPEDWQIALSFVLFVLASLLSWTSYRALGRHWRVDAGLNADHQLVRTGAYRVLRHPIYASVLCILLATGLLITPFPQFLLAGVLCLTGTEIRVRIEDALLTSRFGGEFRAYQRATPAYIPFVR